MSRRADCFSPPLRPSDTEGWEDELASSTGILDASLIRLIAVRFNDLAGDPLETTAHWIDWGLDWLEEDPTRLALVVRPSSVVSALGPAAKGFETDPKQAKAAIQKIRSVADLWISGRPLNDIEQAITSKPSEKCDSAREWALRFVPELAYYFGLTVQIFFRHRTATGGTEPKMPLAFAKHGRCFREGFDHPDKLAFRQILGSIVPRVVIHRKYSELEWFLEAGSDYETIEDAKRRVRKALKSRERSSQKTPGEP